MERYTNSVSSLHKEAVEEKKKQKVVTTQNKDNNIFPSNWSGKAHQRNSLAANLVVTGLFSFDL